MYYNECIAKIRDDVSNIQTEQTININDLFFERIILYLVNGNSVLDIGTGNGFVLSQILSKTTDNLHLFGIDNSTEMASQAEQNLKGQANIIIADNNHLPFSKCKFDVVTAKNVTTLNASEIFRVLKKDCVFVFREYGYGKGMVEIADMFKDRLIRRRYPEYYLRLLTEVGFQIVEFKSYKTYLKYESSEDLAKTVRSFPFIVNYSHEDEARIIEKFKENTTITSDPFILVAKKLKGRE